MFSTHIRQKTANVFLVFFLSALTCTAQQVFAPRELKAIPVKQTPRGSRPPVPKSRPDPPSKMYTQWEPYTGQQASDWARAITPHIENQFAIPVVFGLPNKQYVILGYVYVGYGKVTNPRFEAMRVAASCAKLHGADAIVLRPAAKYSQDWYAAGTAIKWR